MPGIQEKYRLHMEQWERRRDRWEGEFREKLDNVAEDAADVVANSISRMNVLEERILGDEWGDLDDREKQQIFRDWHALKMKLVDVAGRITSVAISRVRKLAERKEQAGWTELVDELRGQGRSLPPPSETVVVMEKTEGKKTA